MESVPLTEEVPTIKAQLLARFITARDQVGKDWRKQLAKADDYFNTMDGVNDMTLTAQATNEKKRRGQIDRVKRVVLALEKLAGIPHPPIL